MIPHFVLYANGADKSIIIANILGCAMFFIGFFITKNSLRELSVPLSLIIAIIFNYSCKKYLSRPFVEDVHEGATK
jgi:hypothetical protein